VVHNAIRLRAPGEFVINGRTTIAADTLADVLQQWLDAPQATEKMLGSELVLHPHWVTADVDAPATSRLAVNAEYQQMETAQNQAGSPHYDTASSVSPQALYAMASKSPTYEAFYEMASNADKEVGEAVSLEAFYDMATNTSGEAASEQAFALHSVGRMSRHQAQQLLQSTGSLPGDFLIRESKDQHVLTLVKPKGTVSHHAMAPAGPGEFVLNGKTKVAARSLARLLHTWLDAPEEARRLLGAELALHDYWSASASANPYYSLAVSSNPHYDSASSTVVNFSNAPQRTPSAESNWSVLDADSNEHAGARADEHVLMGFEDSTADA